MKVLFAKLNSGNYFTWKYKMEMFLRKEKLWTCVTNDPPEIPPPAAAGAEAAAVTAANTARANATTALAQFTENDDIARATIGLCVEDEQLVHIRNAQTAKTSWLALQLYHERNTLVNKVSIMRRICGLKLNESGDMEQHITEMTNLFQKLVDLGENQLNEQWKVAITLSSLPPSYDHLITAIEARAEADITLSLVHSKLIGEFMKRKDVKGNDSAQNNDSATLLKTTNQKVKCYFCKKNNHLRKDCRKYKAWLSKQSQAGNEKVNKIEQQNEYLFNVISTETHSGWIVDSGATSHVTNNKRLFNTFDSSKHSLVTVANSNIESVNGKGTCDVSLVNESGKISDAKLSDVLYAPKIHGNLISVKKLMNNGFSVFFDKGECTINRNGEQVAIADDINGLFTLRKPNVINACSNEKQKQVCLHDLHRMFGHRDPAAIKQMHKNGLIEGIQLIDCGQKIQCEICLEAKTTRLPFPISQHKSKTVLEIIHSDVCGPMNTQSIGKKLYILTLIDDYSKYTVVQFLRQKSEVNQKIQEFVAMVKNKFNKKPKILRSDRGGEYMSEQLLSFLKAEGIQTQNTAPYTPQQNGVAERKNRSLIEMARCLLTDAGLPKYLWAEAVNTANYIQNRTITKGADSIPSELWNGEKQKMNHFEIFGAKCYVLTPAEKRTKLENSSKQMQFIGYEEGSKAYRCYDASNRKIVISRDVRFVRTPMHQGAVSVELNSKEKTKPIEPTEHTSNEDDESLLDSSSGSNNSFLSADNEESEFEGDTTLTDMNYREISYTSSDETSESSTDSEITVVPRNYQSSLDEEYDQLSASLNEFSFTESDSEFEVTSGQINTDDTEQTETEAEHSPRVSHRSTKGVPPERFQANLVVEPKTFSEALSSKMKQKWVQAMEEEFKSLKDNETWELCELPKDRKAIDCKWVYKTKIDSDDKVKRFKARLVAKGYSQKFGQDYDLVFAPVAKQTTFRILLSIASTQKLLVHHMDIKTAFLNGKLNESIYMKQPPGFQSENKNLVCHLKKGIYGLKQAAKLWNDEIHRVLIERGFERSKADPCLYSKKENGEWVFVLIYVDDIAIVAKTTHTIKMVKTMLASKFDVQDLGEIKQYLGIEVTRDKNGIFHLNQTQYIKKIVNDFGMSTAKTSNVPIHANYGKANSREDFLTSNAQFQKLLGCLLYISVNTRPDIAASVSILAQKVCQPKQDDWNELKRVLKYLKGTADLKLALGNNNYKGELLHGYSDANWADDKTNRKSNSGHVFMINGATVCWSSRKQPLVALSTCEAEFIALSEACRAASWIRRLLIDMKQNITKAITIFEDNQSCLKLIEEEERLSDRSKHIDTRFHFVKDYVKKELISCSYCPTDAMVADILTKPVPAKKFEFFRKQFGLHD